MRRIDENTLAYQQELDLGHASLEPGGELIAAHRPSKGVLV
ncbi:hypothetical protein [Desulfuromonas sp. DDH964]|nr:hypothetical protein [Desulfuromonas sp. DDH964]AMV70548.1 hypothetical protein DBW_0148 [Desulfuromonas sp. DDH964]